MTKRAEYIIAGAGASGLAFAYELLTRGPDYFHLTLIDRSLQPDPSKTWCYWATEPLTHPDFIAQSWDRMEVSEAGDREVIALPPYRYYGIHSQAFTSRILELCRGDDRVSLVEGSVMELIGDTERPHCVVDGKSYSADWIFQSALMPEAAKADPPDYPLCQHFLGYELEITGDHTPFTPDRVTLMDFDTDYRGEGVAFMYILPWSERRALVEYTVFSSDPQPKQWYRNANEAYLKTRYGLQPDDYRVTREEYGEIPMQDRRFPSHYAERIINLGAMAGNIKASTGYNFKRSYQQARQMAQRLARGLSPLPEQPSRARFHLYDTLLLRALKHEPPATNIAIFEQLFRRNPHDRVFRFLDEETRFAEELRVMSSVPWAPFLKALAEMGVGEFG